MKIEVVITVWDDGLFKIRRRLEYPSWDDLENLITEDLEKIELDVRELECKKYAIADDDDIPF